MYTYIYIYIIYAPPRRTLGGSGRIPVPLSCPLSSWGCPLSVELSSWVCPYGLGIVQLRGQTPFRMTPYFFGGTTAKTYLHFGPPFGINRP